VFVKGLANDFRPFAGGFSVRVVFGVKKLGQSDAEINAVQRRGKGFDVVLEKL
jgi:hypothetical protein